MVKFNIQWTKDLENIIYLFIVNMTCQNIIYVIQY